MLNSRSEEILILDKEWPFKSRTMISRSSELDIRIWTFKFGTNFRENNKAFDNCKGLYKTR